MTAFDPEAAGRLSGKRSLSGNDGVLSPWMHRNPFEVHAVELTLRRHANTFSADNGNEGNDYRPSSFALFPAIPQLVFGTS